MECVNQLRRRLFPASEPENYIVHNLRTSLSVAEHQRDTALDRLKHAEAELAGAQARHQCLVQNLQLVAKGQYQAVYENIKDSLDPEGWALYRVAERRCKTSVHEFFSTEDNMGYFEAMDGKQLLPWLECDNFGTCDWRQLDCPGGYEVSENRRINTASEEYINYRKRFLRKQSTNCSFCEQRGMYHVTGKALANLRRGFASNAGCRACCPLPQGGLYAVLHRRAVERGFEKPSGSSERTP